MSGPVDPLRAQRGTIDVERRREPKVASGPNIVVDLGSAPTRRAPPRRGNGLVLVVYALATLALALSIYARWF